MSAEAAQLYDPAEHEPLVAHPWDPDRVRAGLDAIAESTLAARRPDGQWPRHPGDDYGQNGDGSLWIGAAGTLWALEQLVTVRIFSVFSPYVRCSGSFELCPSIP